MIKKEVKWTEVKMPVLGQIRVVDEVNVTIEVDEEKRTRRIIMSFEELQRIEMAEHVKIMKKRKKK